MNTIEDAGYILYPHPRPCKISIRKLNMKIAGAQKTLTEHTVLVSAILDKGDGKGWQVIDAG